MKKISSSELAELLQVGFEGDIEFSGRVFCREPVHKGWGSDDRPPTIYQSSGKFSLTSSGLHHGVNEGSYLLSNLESHFYFKPAKGEEIKSHHQDRYGDVIRFYLDSPVKSVIQIEPEKIRY